MSPKALEHDERRRSRRAPLTLLVQYRFNSHEDFLVEYARDLSEGGLFIRTQQPGAMGAMLYLQFYLREQNRLVEGLGRVAHVQTVDHYGEEAGMGVEFIQLDEMSSAEIARLIRARSEQAPSK